MILATLNPILILSVFPLFRPVLSICPGSLYGVGNIIPQDPQFVSQNGNNGSEVPANGGTNRWNVYDNNCNIVDGLISDQNPCSHQHGIFSCTPEPIKFKGYTNMHTGVRHVCQKDSRNETCGNDIISVCCSAIVTTWTIGRPAITIAIEFLLYGIYAVLFGICIFLLRKRKKHYYKLHCCIMAALFTIATASLIINTTAVVVSALGSVNLPPTSFDLRKFSVARLVLLFIGNVITDTILIWRSYAIWNQRIKIMLLPIIIVVANNVFAIVNFVRYLKELSAIWDYLLGETGSDLFLVYIFWTVLTNLILTSMIASRILYISRQAMLTLGESSINKMCRSVVAATLESGMIYPLALLIYASGLLLLSKNPDITAALDYSITSSKNNEMNLVSEVMQYVLNQFAGIAPTLIIVRTGLGISVENVTNTVNTFRAAAGEDSSGLTLSGLDHDGDIELSQRSNRNHNHSVLSRNVIDVQLVDLESQKKNK